ncbi:hypothetical protein [Arsenophonus sp. ENCA]|uniref:hypothetical protein n=1 Tax=Arsenophonus sp. ENCA TaxID=1987579 RepID=UPI0025BFFD5E|nr:hypothetical protein [Arsenophonus sp. ENCA]
MTKNASLYSATSFMVFNSLDVITDAAKSSNFTFNDCINAFKQRLKKGEAKCVDETTHEFYGRFIRKEDFDNEVKILTQILQGKNSQLPLIQNKEKRHFTGLTQGQQKAAELVLTSTRVSHKTNLGTLIKHGCAQQ